MHNLDAYWSVLAQIALVLGFALVTEFRRLSRKWKYEDRVTRRIEGVSYLVLAAAIIFLLNLSLTALSGIALRGVWVTIASVVTGLISTVLILNPVALIATSGNADLILFIRRLWPWSSLSRDRRELKRMTRELDKMIRETVADIRSTRGLGDVLGLIVAEREVTPVQRDEAVKVVRAVTGDSAQQARAFIGGVTGDNPLPPEVREFSGKVRDQVSRTRVRQLAALKRMSVVRRKVLDSRIKHSWSKLPPETEAELKRGFAESQKDFAAVGDAPGS